MTSGYIYCLSNPAYHSNMFKVGMIWKDNRKPEDRAKELSSHTGVPLPFKIEFAKKVNDCKQKEKLLHKLLTKHLERVNPKREFFLGSLEDIKEFIDLIDGEWWEGEIVQDEDGAATVEALLAGFRRPPSQSPSLIRCRKMAECFTNGQWIRHVGTAGTPSIWKGKYDSSKDRIVYCKQIFKTPTQFAEKHYKMERKDRVHSANGWKECECKINGEWVSIYNLPRLSL